MTNIERSKNSIYQKGFGWTYVGEEMARKHNIACAVFVKRIADRGECSCPRALNWYCDQDCVGCHFHKEMNDEDIEKGVVSRNGRAAHHIYGTCDIDAAVSESDGEEATIKDTLASHEALPDEIVEMKIIDVALKNAIKSLDSNAREVLRLSFVEGLPDSEVAKRLGLNARKTLNNRKLKALKKLREQLKDFF